MVERVSQHTATVALATALCAVSLLAACAQEVTSAPSQPPAETGDLGREAPGTPFPPRPARTSTARPSATPQPALTTTARPSDTASPTPSPHPPPGSGVTFSPTPTAFSRESPPLPDLVVLDMTTLLRAAGGCYLPPTQPELVVTVTNVGPARAGRFVIAVNGEVRATPYRGCLLTPRSQ